MNEAVKDRKFFARVAINQTTTANTTLQAAYVKAYSAVDSVNKERAAAAPATSKPATEQNGLVGFLMVYLRQRWQRSPEAEKNAVTAAEKEFANLQEAQQTWATASLAANKKANRDNAAVTKEETQKYLDLQIKDLKGQVTELENKLK